MDEKRRQFMIGAAGFLAAPPLLSQLTASDLAADFPFLTHIANAATPPEDFDYNLKAQRIADDTYVVTGKLEHFSQENGGNIVNIAFIKTEEGVVLIDTGPSHRYATQLVKLIRDTTGREVVRVYNTHFHPDHCLGNQLFDPKNIAALPKTISGLETSGEGFSDNLYRLLGDWMRGTELTIPGLEVNFSSEKFGSHRLEMLPMSGHTDADLAILDHKTGVLFTGDLCFLGRAPTTPHADLDKWHASLKELSAVPHKLLYPGHGTADPSDRSIEETGSYLTWLEKELQKSLQKGEDMLAAAMVEVPPQFKDMKVIREEFERSVAHLYPDMEEAWLPLVGQGQESR